MNTTTLNNKEYTLTEGEGGKLTLTPLINEPEPRKPEAGDVWANKQETIMLKDDGRNLRLEGESSGKAGTLEHCEVAGFGYTYLGKFSEVYVKISDVRDALSQSTAYGYDVISYLAADESSKICLTGKDMALEALRKLGIIAE